MSIPANTVPAGTSAANTNADASALFMAILPKFRQCLWLFPQPCRIEGGDGLKHYGRQHKPNASNFKNFAP
jgi:hypothetical protein